MLCFKTIQKKVRMWVILWALFVPLYALHADATDGQVYVTEQGSGTEDGSTWENAMPSDALPAAVQLANSYSATLNPAVHIGAGTYGQPNQAPATYLTLNQGVALIGGYPSVPTDGAVSNPDSYITTITSAYNLGQGVLVTIASVEVDTPALIQGLTLYGNFLGSVTVQGIVANGNFQIDNCILDHCTSDADGAAIEIPSASLTEVSITNTTIRFMRSLETGAIVSASPITLTNSTLYGLFCLSGGSAISATNTVTMNQCAVFNCSSIARVGTTNSAISITHPTTTSVSTISNSLITNNSNALATSPNDISVSQGTLNLVNTLVYNGVPTDSSILMTSNGTLNLTNCAYRDAYATAITTTNSISYLDDAEWTPGFVAPATFSGYTGDGTQDAALLACDYSLSNSSFLINRGDNSVLSGGDTDINNNVRVQMGYVDIGPYESSAPGPVSVTISNVQDYIYGSNVFVPSAIFTSNIINFSNPTLGALNADSQQVTLSNQLPAGDYVVTEISADSNNWNIIGAAPFTVEPFTVVVTVPNQTIPYNTAIDSTRSAEILTGAFDETFSYLPYVDSEVYNVDDLPGNYGMVIGADSIIVTGSVASNYNFETSPGELTVTQLDPVVTFTVDSLLYGMTIEEANLALTSTSTPGTIAFDDPTYMPNYSDSGVTTFAWSYTPEETDIYTSQTGTLSLDIYQRSIAQNQVVWSWVEYPDDGNIIPDSARPNLSLTLDIPFILDSDYIIAYPDSIQNRGDSMIVTVSPLMNGNYTFTPFTQLLTVIASDLYPVCVVSATPVWKGETLASSTITGYVVRPNGDIDSAITFEWIDETVEVNQTVGWYDFETPSEKYEPNVSQTSVVANVANAPRLLRAVVEDESSVTLTWKNTKTNPAEIAGYRIYSALNPNGPKTLEETILSPESLEATIALSDAYGYYWYVTAIGTEEGAGESPFSNGVRNRSSLVSPYLSATQGNYPNKVVLKWNAIRELPYYQLYRSTTGSASDSVVISGTWNKGRSFTDDGEYAVAPAAGVVYTYFLRVNSIASDSGSELYVETPVQGWTRLNPPVITNVSEGVIGNVIIEWRLNNPTLYGSTFLVARSEMKSNVKEVLGSTQGFIFTDETATPGVRYNYYVCAASSLNDSEWIENIWSRGVKGYAGIEQPSLIYASQGGYYAQIELNWNEVPGANYYNVYRYDPNTRNSKRLTRSGIASRTYVDDDMININTQYCYYVEALADARGVVSSGISSDSATGWVSVMDVVNALMSPGIALDSVTLDSFAYDWDPSLVSFTRAPSVFGQYLNNFKTKKMNFKVAQWSATDLLVLNSNALGLYNVQDYRRALQNGITTYDFLVGEGQVDSFPVDVWMKTRENSKTTLLGNGTYRAYINFLFVPPSLDSNSITITVDSFQNSMFTLTGSDFGITAPKVSIEYVENGKVRSVRVSTKMFNTEKDPISRSYVTNSLTGESVINLVIPKSWSTKQPWGTASELYLVISTNKGLCAVPLTINF